MIVRQIELEQFRNYSALTLEFQPGVNVLYGANGTGKTNIMESVYLCTCASSHRTSRDKELIRQGETAYRVRQTFEDDNGKTAQLDIHYLEAVAGDPLRAKNQRVIRHNGIRLERVGHMMGLFNAVIFAPEDMRLIKDGPQARRRFLDMLISQTRPLYFMKLQQYNLILNQRNRFLKQLREQHYRPVSGDPFDFRGFELDTWDEKLAETAAVLVRYRREAVEALSEFAAESHLSISGGRETLRIGYQTISGLKDPSSVSEGNCDGDRELATDTDQIQEHLLYKLRQSRAEDIQRGNTGAGPHRDDLLLLCNGLSLRMFGSQGQQRTAVLSLKMAELRWIEQMTHHRPVLLLDDVMSELDARRRESLVRHMTDCQVLLTCTEAELVSTQIQELKASTTVSTCRVADLQVFPEGLA